MSRPLSAHGHVQVEQYGRAVISPFGGYVHVPVPAPPSHVGVRGRGDPAQSARTSLNPAKAAGGHVEMHTRNFGTGAAYTYRESVRGVVPGYAGHRPGARDVHHKMAYGGVPTFNPPSSRTPPGQGRRLDNRPTTAFQEYGRGWKVPEERPNETFRDAVGGVLAGYTGFVPSARAHFGGSHVGGLTDVGMRGHVAQRGHGSRVERLHADKELAVGARTLRTAAPVVGYQVRPTPPPKATTRRARAHTHAPAPHHALHTHERPRLTWSSLPIGCAQGHLPRAQENFGTSYWRDSAPNVERETEALYIC